MRTSDFDYNFPKELIAQEPADKRDHSRLMVLNRKTQSTEHRYFYDIIDYLNPGDLLVLNDTKVIPANLAGKKEEGGARVEVLLVRQLFEPATKRRGLIWECLVRPGKRLKVGSRVIFGDGELVGAVLEKLETGEQIIEFCGDLRAYMKKNGEIPLPPYVKRQPASPIPLSHRERGRRGGEGIEGRYQTVYARKDGASAAPTAGLHFTSALLEKIKAKGIQIAHITLHTGLATFKPVYAEKVEDHKMYSEYFEAPEEAIVAVKKAKRVVAVGTTSVRALETIFASKPLRPSFAKASSFVPTNIGTTEDKSEGKLKGETDLFIYPGYKFKVVDAMITNFHWPRSTLIMLVSAFAGKDFIMKAYQEAIQQKYRFFSFGDAMLIL